MNCACVCTIARGICDFRMRTMGILSLDLNFDYVYKMLCLILFVNVNGVLVCLDLEGGRHFMMWTINWKVQFTWLGSEIRLFSSYINLCVLDYQLKSHG